MKRKFYEYVKEFDEEIKSIDKQQAEILPQINKLEKQYHLLQNEREHLMSSKINLELYLTRDKGNKGDAEAN